MSLSVFRPDDIRTAYIDAEAAGETGEPRSRTPDEVYQNQLDMARQRAEKGYCDRDLWDIGSWFLEIMQAMLAEYKATRHGSPGCLGQNYTGADGILRNDTCHAEWDAILDEMIRLLKESSEDTCSRKNPRAEEYANAMAEFIGKYGIFGERLNEGTSPSAAGVRAHFMSELPEYAGIDAAWHEEENKLEKYRKDCLARFMELFRRWLPWLAD